MRYIQRIKDAGLTTYHMTETLEEALLAQEAGADGVVRGGAEKGGTAGDQNLHLFTLLQKARRQLDIPIVATGGLADGTRATRRSPDGYIHPETHEERGPAPFR
ncbi:nitronate monooxygenase [Novosphingobium colocasiae]